MFALAGLLLCLSFRTIVMDLSIFLFILSLFSVIQSHKPHLRHSRLHSSSRPSKATKRADDDPSDFSWVKR
ncbi:Folylpolyglutamate synthase [Fusarium oxysporum f. sp. albedinis]|nr:Folylpolyglutamate synthase [Fusarium oxysporum f. sp. albedinis]